MKIALAVGYDGSHYHGWQSQKGLLATVQYQLERALSKVANHPVNVICAGRTDAGVHAVEQIVHFDTTANRSNYSWVMGTNRYMPSDITAYWACPVVASGKGWEKVFHARFSAYARYYRYIICEQPIRPTLHRNRVGWYYQPLDFHAMQNAAQAFLGEHDFENFRSRDCQAKTSVRKVSKFIMIQKPPFIIIDIIANAFLHNMVRNMVGALVEVGHHKQKPDWIDELLNSPEKKPTKGISTAPAQGLYLMKVFYPENFKLPHRSEAIGPFSF